LRHSSAGRRVPDYVRSPLRHGCAIH